MGGISLTYKVQIEEVVGSEHIVEVINGLLSLVDPCVQNV